MNIAIFGSAFNPPTLGHADAIASLLESGKFQQIWLIPSFKHAFAKEMLAYETRVSLLQKFVNDLDTTAVLSRPIEHIISDGDNPVYTWDVLNYLQQQYGEAMNFSFVMGPDNQANWHKFYKAEEVAQRWELVVVPERKAIRSSLVREAIKQGQPIDELVSPSVLAHLLEQSLYQSGK